MKKILILTSLIMAGLSLFAQKIIENPKYGGVTASYVKITGIELHDTITKVNFEVKYRPHYWIRVSSKDTHIQNSNGGEKLFVKRAEGIKLNKYHWTPESGINIYTLYFPAIDKNTEKIDFLEESWKIFDIELTKVPDELAVPGQLLGNWFSDNNWLISFFEEKAIYKKQLWHCEKLKGSGKKGLVKLINDNETVLFSYKINKDGTCKLTKDEEQAVICRKDAIQKDDTEYSRPVFNPDSATYSGWLKNYSPRMGQTTGQIHVNNLLSGKQESYVVKFDDNGMFSVKIPFYYPHNIYVRFPAHYNESVYLEPGKELFHIIDFSEGSKFFGQPAALNHDLEKIKDIYSFDYIKMKDTILDMGLEQYKKYCMNLAKKDLGKLDEKYNNKKIGKKAYQIKKLDLQYRYFNLTMEYKWNYESAYRKHNKIPRKQRKLDIEIEQPDTSYYDFLTPEIIDNPLAVVANSYDIFFNRIKYLPLIRGKANQSHNTNTIIFKLKEEGFEFTKEENIIIDKLSELDKLSKAPEIKEYNDKYLSLVKKFHKNHKEKIEEYRKDNNDLNYEEIIRLLEKDGVEITPEERELVTIGKEFSNSDYSKQLSSFHKEYADQIKELYSKYKAETGRIMSEKRIKERNNKFYQIFGLEKGFATDVMASEDYCRKIVEEVTPVSEQTLHNIQSEIITPFIAEYIETANNNTLARIEENSKKTGYVVNEIPDTEGEKLFDAIMEKYKGKVVFVDFWATWCGPCRSGITRMQPLKEEFKDKDVAFVYITNPSSPESAYNNMIPDIKGEHYRVSQDDWNYLSQKFQISGIPHYTLVGKDGKVINPHLSLAMDNNNLKELLNKHLVE